jgi:chemotaxis protein CheY-P-specific phosphatase CheC
MELQQFVSEALKQIVSGISDAQKEMVGIKAFINPPDPRYYGVSSQGCHLQYGDSVVQNIEFDVAVTTSEGKETKGGIGIFVGSVGVGTQGKSDSSSMSVSRIKFSVPIAFPTQSGG